MEAENKAAFARASLARPTDSKAQLRAAIAKLHKELFAAAVQVLANEAQEKFGELKATREKIERLEAEAAAHRHWAVNIAYSHHHHMNGGGSYDPASGQFRPHLVKPSKELAH